MICDSPLPTQTATPRRCPLRIRWMCRGDLPEVVAIERASFEFPWCDADFLQLMQAENSCCLIAEQGGQIAAMFAYETQATALRLLNLMVFPELRRTGMGRELVESLKERALGRGRTLIAAEVRERNLPAQQFLRACGFRATATLPDFYEDCDESAILFEWRADQKDA